MQIIKGLCITLSIIFFGLGLGAMVEVIGLSSVQWTNLWSTKLFLTGAVLGLICVVIDADRLSWRLLPWRRQNRRRA